MTEVRELTEKEYNGAMSGGIKNVTESAEFITDIWEYARNFSVRMLLSEYGLENKLIEAVYENGTKEYQHILLFGDRENVYVVIVVDVIKKEIIGHYYLDLNEKYGLEEI